jgi:AAA family ATP:ADP antiporter
MDTCPSPEVARPRRDEQLLQSPDHALPGRPFVDGATLALSRAVVSPPSRLAQVLARLLRPFAKVEPAEAITATVMTLAAFLLLSAYYLLKTVREPLILLEGGAEVKLYARAAQAVLMVGVVHVYGKIAQRVGRLKLLAIVFLFFLSNLVVFIGLSFTHLSIGLAFFLWVGLFSYTCVAQFWALAADIYSDAQGKRLFPILGIGSSAGAVIGSRLAKSLVPLGAYALMSAAAVLLVVCVCLLAWVERRARSDGAKASKPEREEPLSSESALHLLLRDRYLVLMGVMILLLNWVNSAGEFIFDRTILAGVDAAVARGMTAEAFIGGVKADYFAWYNLLGLVLQMFAVSRILAKVGVRNALLILPVFAVFGYASAAALPVLAVLRLVKIGENALEYSVAETSRHALFLVTSRVEKYVGKTSIDTVAVRLGAIMAATVVWIGGRISLSLAWFAGINVALSLIWIAVVFVIGREHGRRSRDDAAHLAAEPDTPGKTHDRPQLGGAAPS